MGQKRILFGVVICVALLTGSCATSPTGRKQLAIMPDSQMNSMGGQAFDQMKQKTPPETNPRVVNYVRCVAMAVAHEAEDDTGVKDWEVQVFKDDTANAFALPGGKIGVHTGLLKVAVTPGQLAAVLGHEVGHVIARHGNERVSQTSVAGLGMAGLSAAMGSSEPSTAKTALFTALGLGVNGVILKYSRTHESEADIIGQRLMAHAGFDPAESIELWKNMAKAGGKQPPEFISTHPSHETRIGDLQGNLPQVRPIYEGAKSSGKNPQCRM